MPYAKSSARQTFQQRAADLRRSFRYAKVRPLAMKKEIRTLVFHASVFHLSAYFEDYLLQCLSGWMYELQRRDRASSDLPSRFRYFLFLRANEGTLKNLVITGSEREALDRMDSAQNGLNWLDEAAAIPKFGFYDRLIKEKKFPTSDNVEMLFGRFGVKDVVGEMAKRTKSDVQLKMKSFIDVRNTIAHEFPPDITEDDLEDYFRSISLWVATIDRIMFAHVVRCSGVECWQR